MKAASTAYPKGMRPHLLHQIRPTSTSAQSAISHSSSRARGRGHADARAARVNARGSRVGAAVRPGDAAARCSGRSLVEVARRRPASARLSPPRRPTRPRRWRPRSGWRARRAPPRGRARAPRGSTDPASALLEGEETRGGAVDRVGPPAGGSDEGPADPDAHRAVGLDDQVVDVEADGVLDRKGGPSRDG
jgi:hypothetical protein